MLVEEERLFTFKTDNFYLDENEQDGFHLSKK